MIDIRFAAEPSADAAVLILPVDSGADAGRGLGGEAADVARAAAAAARFTGEGGSAVDLHLAAEGGVRRILLVGIGGADGGEKAGGAIVARLLTSGVAAATVDLSGIPAEGRVALAAGIAEAAVLRSWRHDAYRTRPPEKLRASLATLTIVVGADVAAAEAAWSPRRAVAEGVAFTRALVAEPANILYPASFAARCEALDIPGLEIEVLGEAEMHEAGMGALLGVAQGSVREPKLVVMRWDGSGGTVAEPTVFVGKGVTFDTGGISLKPGPGMGDMKWDMGGAGAVAGAMVALARRQAKAHVVGVLGLVENMPDGNAQRPGDVVTSLSGQTIEILNTDAEGRLVLCDAITWAQRRFTPKTIVDLATLTGNMIVALGHEYGGIFANDDALADRLVAAGEAVGEKLWRFPMGKAYDKMIDSDIADMKNIGPREAGSISAAQFLRRFVDDGVAWAHLDIAGMVWAAKPAHLWDKGATGYGVRLIDRFVADVLEA